MDEQDFVIFSKKWEENSSIIIESKLKHLKVKSNIFNMALSRIPNSFAEAVVDIFLEDNDFPIDDSDLIICIKNGSLGLKKSVFYRKNISKKIINLCKISLKNS
ncbi:hypothetical protein [Gilliamella sp. Pas-s27]|uniref:hypothetical protein n=1 Tax=Gilliamella sp. Pas-s27 TaxID=2687311 RepID=UPI00136582F4|nr:hypothetical protein [Gilliamella sp. Pas-s27]MWP47533.1 hypothetical protein [Gilliamella sp. Pas-s27]